MRPFFAAAVSLFIENLSKTVDSNWIRNFFTIIFALLLGLVSLGCSHDHDIDWGDDQINQKFIDVPLHHFVSMDITGLKRPVRVDAATDGSEDTGRTSYIQIIDIKTSRPTMAFKVRSKDAFSKPVVTPIPRPDSITSTIEQIRPRQTMKAVTATMVLPIFALRPFVTMPCRCIIFHFTDAVTLSIGRH